MRNKARAYRDQSVSYCNRTGGAECKVMCQRPVLEIEKPED